MIALRCCTANTLLVATGEGTRKHNHQETACLTMTGERTRKQHPETRRRTWTGRRSGRGFEGYRYRSDIAGTGARRLSAEDDHSCGSGNKDEPQGDKGEGGTGTGAKEPVAPGS